jgi:thymidylate kinase
MIIEFVGSTGAGKTTLISQVQRSLAHTTSVTTSADLVTAKLGLPTITHTTAKNIIQELYGFLYLIRSLQQNKASIAFSLRMLVRKADSVILTINNVRSLVRKLGVNEMIRRQQKDRIILVDEGTVLLAHVLFVYNRAYYTPEEIRKFVSLIPLPDVVVYVKAPLDTLIKRSLQRSDPPREMKSKDPEMVEKYVNDAVAMFDQLIATEEIRNRVLIVDNPQWTEKQSDEAAKYISEFVLSHQVVPL